MRIYVAIDAGQTHTECVVVDRDGRICGMGNGGPSYVQDGSMIVGSAFDRALAGANIAATDVRSVLVGATGGHIPGRLDAVDRYMRKQFPAARVEVVPDGEFVLRSCVGDGIGGVLIAGTGSVAVGNAGNGTITVGGYGYLFGDEGAGSWLVLTWIRHALRAADRRTPLTMLATAICQHFGVGDVRQIPGVVYASGVVDVHMIASAARLIIDVAAEDELAHKLVQEAGVELAGLSGRLAATLGLADGTTFPLHLVGGLWQAPALLSPFRAALPAHVTWQIERVVGSVTISAARSLCAVDDEP